MIFEPSCRVRRSRISFVMLRKKMNPKITNAMKLREERAYNRSVSLAVSTENSFQRLEDCSKTSTVSDTSTNIPRMIGEIRLCFEGFGLLTYEVV